MMASGNFGEGSVKLLNALDAPMDHSGSNSVVHTRIGDVLHSTISMEKSEEVDTEEGETVPTSLQAIGRQAPVGFHTISSQLASAGSTCVFYPFDVLKTRFMAQDGTALRQSNGQVYKSIPRALSVIYKEEGIQTLFRGCPVAVSGAIVAWGVYMYLYRLLCNVTEYTSYLGRSSVSVVSSGVSSCVACPIFLIKSRMQLEEANRTNHYRSFWRGLRYTVSTSGVRSLWRGLSLQLCLMFPNALGIPTYDTLKRLVLRYRWHHAVTTELNLFEIGVCSTLTKIWILILSHPLVMLKVRMQDERAVLGAVQYRTVPQSISNVLKTRGARGMYRGFTTALVHSLPRSLLHYVMYEKALSVLCSRQGT
ncbi:putative mitochondrial mitochondrial carrier protein [Leptomonas pyrrhocoris]|uniref:Putative mitochondrial mitochondrial carrier protein n=1 Tax=Leptomonas pyrrhocoris TaxID=157538 RepID=A0A0M9G8G1_LEPPY|nr:putative mitochondrial mitochondrial carrier protein [Leptomonas pyrrhocoris]KPA84636.1 putative mitochondrial mitochondrial carrier protein [Leptomonas pyrrhocoris]|eukprot:XP_015663075.1 putative mitochondrial mitochondrial carrier protein [Leptomonas pyrrhocoris]